tara:strand:+ start:1184 stop:1549 length:366 start_codon:yes stop_codon:yes gene_type:complete
MKQLRDRMINAKEYFYRGKRDKGIISFMQLSPLHYAIMLEVGIGHLEEKKINFEILIKRLPNSLGSRSTVGSILNDYVARKFFCKGTGGDKRKRVYGICPSTLQLINVWFEEQKVSLREVA